MNKDDKKTPEIKSNYRFKDLLDELLDESTGEEAKKAFQPEPAQLERAKVLAAQIMETQAEVFRRLAQIESEEKSK